MKLYPNITRGLRELTRGFKKDPLTVNQVREILSGVDRSTLQGKRDYALLNLLIRTGLRTIEVIRAEAGDIRQGGGEAILWIQGKGHERRICFTDPGNAQAH